MSGTARSSSRDNPVSEPVVRVAQDGRLPDMAQALHQAARQVLRFARLTLAGRPATRGAASQVITLDSRGNALPPVRAEEMDALLARVERAGGPVRASSHEKPARAASAERQRHYQSRLSGPILAGNRCIGVVSLQ